MIEREVLPLRLSDMDRMVRLGDVVGAFDADWLSDVVRDIAQEHGLKGKSVLTFGVAVNVALHGYAVTMVKELL